MYAIYYNPYVKIINKSKTFKKVYKLTLKTMNYWMIMPKKNWNLLYFVLKYNFIENTVEKSILLIQFKEKII